MYAATAITTVLSLASMATAAPALYARAGPEWLITGLSRVCTPENTECTWTFGIQSNPADPASNTPCTHKTVAGPGYPASQHPGTGPSFCGPYTVTSGWSGQFGPNAGFTTLAVSNPSTASIAYPSYPDAAVAAGTVVPDALTAVSPIPAF
jgi:hypothetical protein